MKTHCINLPDALVRAALAGHVTQIRVPMKPQPAWHDVPNSTIQERVLIWPGRRPPTTQTSNLLRWEEASPLGQPGDKLVVREAWAPMQSPNEVRCRIIAARLDDTIRYRADGIPRGSIEVGFPWRSAAQMPTWASRLAFEVEAVRVEQARDMTEEDACACGIEGMDGWFSTGALVRRTAAMGLSLEDARPTYAEFWDSIHGKRFPWASSPWQWVAKVRRS